MKKHIKSDQGNTNEVRNWEAELRAKFNAKIYLASFALVCPGMVGYMILKPHTGHPGNTDSGCQGTFCSGKALKNIT